MEMEKGSQGTRKEGRKEGRGDVFVFDHYGQKILGKRLDGVGSFCVEIYPNVLHLGECSDFDFDNLVSSDNQHDYGSMPVWDIVIVPYGAFNTLDTLDELNGSGRMRNRFDGMSLNIFGEVIDYWGTASHGSVDELNKAELREVILWHCNCHYVYQDGVKVVSDKTLIYDGDEEWENFLGFLRSHIADITSEFARFSKEPENALGISEQELECEYDKYPLVYPRGHYEYERALSEWIQESRNNFECKVASVVD